MKKIIFKLMLSGIILVMASSCAVKNDEEYQEEKFIIGNTLDDGRVIHFTFDVPYNDDGLSLALSNKEITVDEFIKSLEHIDTLKDGGSKLYKYSALNKDFGSDNFYVIECNSLDNIKDIFVAKNRKSLDGKCSVKINDLDGVSMKIKEGTLTNTSATVIITDTSNRENIYGSSYRIDKNINGKWVKLDIIFSGNYAWNSIGYTVDENKRLEFNINWKILYGKLESGKYRIVKDTSEAGEGTTHYITAEFEIK